MGYVLGLDGGGTQTRAQVATADGILRGEGTGGASNIAAVPLAEALISVHNAAEAALAMTQANREDIHAVCAGVAGTSFTPRRMEFEDGLRRLFPNARVAVEPDYAIALTGATAGAPGVIVIAGTGSAAYGEDGVGRAHKAGAYGYLIDDAGSGYGVGRSALAAVLHAADGTGDPTSLQERVLSALSLASVADIVPGIYSGTLGRVTIASLSRSVAAAGEDGDAVALAILRRAGGALARLVQGVTAALFPVDAPPFPIVQVGGLWHAGPALTDVFTRSVARFAPQAMLAPPLHSPVQGAVQRALRL